MEKTWSHDFYRETDPAKRQQILKAHAGEEEDWAEEYRNRLWTARYGKYRLQKDEFVKCLMELKYLAEALWTLGVTEEGWELGFFLHYAWQKRCSQRSVINRSFWRNCIMYF